MRCALLASLCLQTPLHLARLPRGVYTQIRRHAGLATWARVNHDLSMHLVGSSKPNEISPNDPTPNVSKANISKAKPPKPSDSKQKGPNRERKGPLESGPVESGPDTTTYVTQDYITQECTLPTPEQYPNAPAGLWRILEMEKDIDNAFLRTIFIKKLTIEFGKPTAQSCKNSEYHHALSATSYHGEKIHVGGSASTSTAAKRVCALHLLAKLHESGLLREFWGEPTIAVQMEDVSDTPSKTAIYEYASQYMLVPEVTMMPITEEVLKAVRAQGDIHPKYQCTIKLPDLKIEAIGAGHSYLQAENAALMRFNQLSRDLERDSAFEQQKMPPLDAATMQSFANFVDSPKGSLFAVVENVEMGSNPLYKAWVKQGRLPVNKPVITSKKSDAQDLAFIAAAITLGQQDSSLLPRFQDALRAGGGKVLQKIRPTKISLSKEALNVMGAAVRRHQGLWNPKRLDAVESETPEHRRRVRRATNHSLRNIVLQEALEDYRKSSETQKMREKREELPINQHRTEIVQMVEGSPFSVVVGATGSGKTTQVPQMFLEAASEAGVGASCNVICTQPRRIAATSVARRVADERAEKLGKSVGYIVRHNSVPPKHAGSILFCTTGVLLRQLQHHPDSIFDSASHIVLDEVHERDILLDFLMVVLKQGLKQRRALGKSVPKVVLMSATMNAELFSKYFGSEDKPCPSINVPGRLFPVKNRYLREIHSELHKHGDTEALKALLNEKDTLKYLQTELQCGPESQTNKDEEVPEDDPNEALAPVGLVAATVSHVAKTTDKGAILVFLPGQGEILKTKDLLLRTRVFDVDFRDSSRYKLFILHSAISAEAQEAVFQPIPPGCRKIILSTNIAETSVTIPDVQHVIDSGKHREKRYDSVSRIGSLTCSWVSKANAKQRAGRAGRVQNGNYYGLYTEERLATLKITGHAEMLRSDLQKICLDVKAYKFAGKIGDFLSQALEPPSMANVSSAVQTLQSLDALTENEELTPLGELLAALPVQPALGKMIVLGIIFRCLEPLIIIAALSEVRNLFKKPSGKRSRWEPSHAKWVDDSQSEHIAEVLAVMYIRELTETYGYDEAYDFALDNFISMSAYEQTLAIAQDIQRILIDNHYIPPTSSRGIFGGPALNTNSDNIPFIKALALVGFAPNLAFNTNSHWFRTPTADSVLIHPKSVMMSRQRKVNFRHTVLTYSSLFNANSILFMRTVTEVSHGSALLFGGKLTVTPRRYGSPLLKLDDWLPFRLDCSSLVYNFRKIMDAFLSNTFTEIKSRRIPNRRETEGEQEHFADNSKRDEIVKTIVEVVDLLGDQSRMRYEKERAMDRIGR